MANIAPNITSVGISCEPPPPTPPGEGAIAHATSGKKRLIGRSAYPSVRERPSPDRVERAAADRLAHRRHEAEVEAHVVQREQPVREQLLRHEEMAEIRAREGATRVTVTGGVERAALADPLRLFDRHRSARRERLSVPRIARRQHAVEHVDAPRDRLHEVLRLADTHEIPRAVGGRNSTPSSLSLRSLARLKTWKPPESVRIARCQPMKRCKPPRSRTTSGPGRSSRW